MQSSSSVWVVQTKRTYVLHPITQPRSSGRQRGTVQLIQSPLQLYLNTFTRRSNIPVGQRFRSIKYRCVTSKHIRTYVSMCIDCVRTCVVNHRGEVFNGFLYKYLRLNYQRCCQLYHQNRYILRTHIRFILLIVYPPTRIVSSGDARVRRLTNRGGKKKVTKYKIASNREITYIIIN